MAEHLDKEHKLYTARKSRFPQQYLDDVFSLFMILIKDVTERYSRDYTLIQSLNNSLAFFLLDCFSLMDRGFVFVRIKEYCRVVSAFCLHLLKVVPEQILIFGQG